jgi:peptidoglycan L-alanyl-D-glutamate endopeptidase CwlK
MPSFGKVSLDRLRTCHPDIQKVMNEAIKHYDFTILFGYRTPAEQFELFKKGRTLVGKEWKKTGATVTDKDGTKKVSNHNFNPSKAIDIAPFPIDWNNINRFLEMAKVVKKAAETVGVKIVYGGDWKMKDYPHFELGV